MHHLLQDCLDVVDSMLIELPHGHVTVCRLQRFILHRRSNCKPPDWLRCRMTKVHTEHGGYLIDNGGIEIPLIDVFITVLLFWQSLEALAFEDMDIRRQGRLRCRCGLLISKRWIVLLPSGTAPITTSIQDNQLELICCNNRDYQSVHFPNHRQPKSQEKTYQSPLYFASRTQQHNNSQRRWY